jgi:hypothetical protein
LICIELQPRAKSRVFASRPIRSHPLPVTFHFFLPQICHNHFAHFFKLKNIDRLFLIDDSKIHTRYRTSRLTRDGRQQSRSVVIVTMIGRLLKIPSMPQICHSEFRLLSGARIAEVTWTSASVGERRLNTSVPAPNGRPVTVDQLANRDDKLPVEIARCSGQEQHWTPH